MNPLVGEVDLHSVDVVHLLVGIELLHLFEDGIHIGGWSEVDAILGNEILGECGAKLANLAALVGQ